MLRSVAIIGLAAFGLASLAGAQEPYPQRPVRVVVAAAPGGNPDVLARLVSQRLTEMFGKAFVVENVPGAGGVVAAKIVAGSAPDGHTLMFGDSGALAISTALQPDLAYHPLRDFTPVTALATVPTVLVVHPSVPGRSLKEFIDLAKSKPGDLRYGSAGPGSIHHLTMAVFAAAAGIDLLHVPYRGGTALVNGLIKGEVHAGWSGIPNVAPLIEAGNLRVLCISTGERSQSMPNVPTAIELGIKDFDYATMMGVQMSAGAPPQLVARLQDVMAKVLREPQIAERMAMLGMELKENGTDHYARFMKEDLDRYMALVKSLGIQSK